MKGEPEIMKMLSEEENDVSKRSGKMEEKSVEIKQVSEREIWVGENRFYLAEDDIIYITIVGDVDKDIAIACRDAPYKLADMIEGKAHLIIDLNNAGHQSSEARKIGQEAFENENLGKIAYHGLHPVARVIASFLMGVSKKEDVRFFKTKEDALAWLKE